MGSGSSRVNLLKSCKFKSQHQQASTAKPLSKAFEQGPYATTA